MQGTSAPFPNGTAPVDSPTLSIPRVLLHILLLLVTFVTTSVVGSGFAASFRQNRPLDVDDLLRWGEFFHHPGILTEGFAFSIPLIIMLLAHEMGHYLACRYYRVDASLPYFMPAPVLIGTLGAFIRIRAPIYSKRKLFDIAVAGPLAGFSLILPVLAIGVSLSKVIPGIAERGDIVFGVPGVIRILEMLIFPGAPASDIYLHPMARAAWVGILATALNLLPIGQLDGGHILYAFVGQRAKLASRILAVSLIALGWNRNPDGTLSYTYSWLVWSILLFLFAMRHPVIYDSSDLGRRRRILGAVALATLVLCFSRLPVR
jgi:membrane-associated protease RseP (regulator of RpoE activity)